LSDQLNSLFNAFQSVVTDPTSTAQRQALVNQAQSLTARILQRSKIAPPFPTTPSSN
jgi:flagellar hook-associated protein FlgK